MPTARRGGTGIFWRSWGAAPAQVLLLHCTLAHSGAWTGVAKRLGLPAVAFDMPGHGRSGPYDPARDYQSQCLDVAGDFVGAGPMDLIGHSFGATVALRLAVERPEAVRRLVLIEPVFFAAARGTQAFADHVDGRRAFVEAMQEGDRRRATRHFTDLWGTGAGWDALSETQRQALADRIDLIPAQDGALFEDNAGLLRPGRLETVPAPVLLVEGGASPPVIDAIASALAARLPRATRHRVEGASHMVPITHPAETAQALAAFLSP